MPDPNPLELCHRVTDHIKRRSRIADPQSPPQSFELGRARRAFYLHVVNLLDGSSFGQQLRKAPVIRQDDQTFAVEIKPAYREKSAPLPTRHQIDD
jgi:hypothetical protein